MPRAKKAWTSPLSSVATAEAQIAKTRSATRLNALRRQAGVADYLLKWLEREDKSRERDRAIAALRELGSTESFEQAVKALPEFKDPDWSEFADQATLLLGEDAPPFVHRYAARTLGDNMLAWCLFHERRRDFALVGVVALASQLLRVDMPSPWVMALVAVITGVDPPLGHSEDEKSLETTEQLEAAQKRRESRWRDRLRLVKEQMRFMLPAWRLDQLYAGKDA